MRFLLDTHILLWIRGDPSRLSSDTRRTLADPANSVFVSVISLWEILIKCRIGKLKIDVAMMIDGLAPKSKWCIR